MATYDNSYSRFIAWTKVILPIIALGILSTLFLFSRGIDPSLSIPYADVDVEELAREQRVGAPNYAGVTQDGSAISITAKAARPDPDNSEIVTATDLTAIIEDPAGGYVDITASNGVIDSGQKIVTLSGGVRVKTSTGYTINTSKMITALDETAAFTEGSITADGPLGTLEAGLMELRPENGEKGSHLLVFKGGVKLIYDPKGR